MNGAKNITNMNNDSKDIISAKEAAELTRQKIADDNSDLIPIMYLIHNAIERKEYYCHYSGVLKDYTKKKLQDLGYKVEYFKGGGDQREPDYYKISWDMIYAYPN